MSSLTPVSASWRGVLSFLSNLWAQTRKEESRGAEEDKLLCRIVFPNRKNTRSNPETDGAAAVATAPPDRTQDQSLSL